MDNTTRVVLCYTSIRIIFTREHLIILVIVDSLTVFSICVFCLLFKVQWVMDTCNRANIDASKLHEFPWVIIIPSLTTIK